MNDSTKETLTVVAYVAVALIAYKILKEIFGIFTPPEGSTTGSNWANAQINEQNLSYEKDFYNSLADQIEEAAYGGITGELTEDDTAMFEAMSKALNNDDVKQLFKAYGVRGRGALIQSYANLPQLISGSLDNDLKEELNNLYRSRGISYTF